MKLKRLVGLTTLALLLLLAGIVVFQSVKTTSQSKEKVAATIFPLYDIVKNIAGNDIETVLLLKPGASPHTFDPTPKEIKKLSGSKAVFTIGHGLDDWSLKISESVGIKSVMIVDRNVELVTFEDEHEHGNIDPHYWLSVRNAKLIAKQVRDELTLIYPGRRKNFTDNYNDYIKKLDNLENEIGRKLSGLESIGIATFHSAWSYFAKDHKVSVITTFEEFPGEEPTAQYLAKFQQKIKEKNVRVIFSEPQFSTKPLEPIAKDLGVTISVLDPLGGVPGRESFEELMQYNTNQIVNALR
jgi:zinc transport system substrate-binding protein